MFLHSLRVRFSCYASGTVENDARGHTAFGSVRLCVSAFVRPEKL